MKKCKESALGSVDDYLARLWSFNGDFCRGAAFACVLFLSVGWSFKSQQSGPTTITGSLKIVSDDGKSVAEIGQTAQTGNTPRQNAITLFSQNGKPSIRFSTNEKSINGASIELLGADGKKQVEILTGNDGGYVYTNSASGKPRAGLSSTGYSGFGSDDKLHIVLGEMNKRYGFQIADHALHSYAELYCMPEGVSLWLHDPKGNVTITASGKPELSLAKRSGQKRTFGTKK